MKKSFLILVLLSILFNSVSAQTAFLVKDTYYQTLGSNPNILTEFNGELYFFASDSIGRKLWATDGTESGTRLVKDSVINLFFNEIEFCIFNNYIYFVAGTSIFRTNGTPGNLERFRNINSNFAYFQIFNNKLYFNSDAKLFWTDGNITSILHNQCALNQGNGYSLTEIAGVFQNKLYFIGSDCNSGNELWSTDGTITGTSIVKDIWPGSGSGICCRGSHVTDSCIYFSAVSDTLTYKYALWKSDGTNSSTEIVKDSFPLMENSNFLSIGNLTYITIPGTYDGALWVTNGTDSGTVYLTDIQEASNLYAYHNKLYFISSGTFYPSDIYSMLMYSDGTVQGTDVLAGSSSDFIEYNGLLYFLNYNSANGNELFSYDGSSMTFICDNLSAYGFYVYDSLIFFNLNNGPSGFELFVFDGNCNNIRLLKDINSKEIPEQKPIPLTEFQGAGFLSAYDSHYGRQLWKTDGTDTGTVRISTDVGFINKIIKFDGYMYIASNNGFFKSDGTSAGTVRLHYYLTHNVIVYNNSVYFLAGNYFVGGYGFYRYNPSSNTVALLEPLMRPGTNMTVFNNSIYFDAKETPMPCIDMWRSDGVNTWKLMNGYQCNTTYGYDGPKLFTEFKDKLYFLFGDDPNGVELWVTDGTNNGTRLVYDLKVGSGNSDISSIVVMGNKMFFVANNGINGKELFVYSGNPFPPYMVKDINPNGDGIVAGPVLMNNKLYFAADDGNGIDFWVSDGTASGTVILKEMNAAIIDNISSIGNIVLFNGDGELWISDGTEQGTYQLADINPGPAASNPADFMKMDSKIYFNANDGIHGRELWAIDATLTFLEKIKNDELSALEIFPNPSNGKFTVKINNVDLNDTEADVYTAAGMLLKKVKLVNTSADVDLSELPSGLYYIKVQGLNPTAFVIK